MPREIFRGPVELGDGRVVSYESRVALYAEFAMSDLRRLGFVTTEKTDELTEEGDSMVGRLAAAGNAPALADVLTYVACEYRPAPGQGDTSTMLYDLIRSRWTWDGTSVWRPAQPVKETQ